MLSLVRGAPDDNLPEVAMGTTTRAAPFPTVRFSWIARSTFGAPASARWARAASCSIARRLDGELLDRFGDCCRLVGRREAGAMPVGGRHGLARHAAPGGSTSLAPEARGPRRTSSASPGAARCGQSHVISSDPVTDQIVRNAARSNSADFPRLEACSRVVRRSELHEKVSQNPAATGFSGFQKGAAGSWGRAGRRGPGLGTGRGGDVTGCA
jgi:hypothetical protein